MANLQAQAAHLPASEASLVSFSLRVPGIVPLLVLGAVIRLALAFLPGFGVDMGTFQAWAEQLAHERPWHFYDEGFNDYAPGYMYVLWFIGEINKSAHFSADEYRYVLKLPSIVADLSSAYLLYRMLGREKPEVQLGATAIYVLFPAALLIGPIWGQVDSLLAFFLLLSIYFISRDKPVHGALAYAVGFIIKPQAIAALPFLAFWILRDRLPRWSDPVVRRELIQCTVFPLLVLLVIITPFFKLEPWRLFEQLQHSTDVENYRVNSFWAYNFWNMFGLFDMGFKCDLASACAPNAQSTEWLGIATRWWGLAFCVLSISAVIAAMWRSRGTGALALGTALCVMAFYLFLTRMHERYMFAMFLPFLLACALLHSRALWAAFIATSLVHFGNLYHVYAYYNPNELRRESVYKLFERNDFFHFGGFNVPLMGQLETVQVGSIILVVSFFALLGYSYRLSQATADQAAEGT